MVNTKKANKNESNDNTKFDGEPLDELMTNVTICSNEDPSEASQKARKFRNERDKESVKEIDSLESFYIWYKEKIKLLDELNELMPFGNKFKLFFRGEDDNTYNLIPSIYRNGWITSEHKFFNESINKCPESFKECKTAFEKLAKMQHYRIPTRLLDITENPLIALYFATNKGPKNNNGRFYCFYISESAIKYPDNDITALLSNAASVDINRFYEREYYESAFAFIKKYKRFASAKNTDTRYKLQREAKQLFKENPVVNEMLLKSQYDCGYSSSQYTFDDLAQFLCVKPKINNWRISNQNSAFLLFGFLFDKNYVMPLINQSQCLDFFNLLSLKFNDLNRRKIEDSIILKLPLNKKFLEMITRKRDGFRLIHDASPRKHELSKEITKETAKLFYDFLYDCQSIRLNTHSGLSTGRHYYGIKEKLPTFGILKFFHNLIYKKEPLIFFDSIETNFKAKDKISVDLSRISISDDFIFPELENISPVLRIKFEHKQPIVLEKVKDGLEVTHLSAYAQEHSGLQLGDIILDFNSQEEFLNKFTLSECVPVTVLRKTPSETFTIENNSNNFKGNNESDERKDIFEMHSLNILFSNISSDDNPLFANDSDGSIL